MSVSNKMNYNKYKEYWNINDNNNNKKNLSVATHIQYCLPQFSMRYCSKSLRKNSSKSGFVTIILQVYKDFFCSKTNRWSLHWVEIGTCNGRESSNVLNNICLIESCMFSLWYSLNHLKVLERNSFDSWQCNKVCSIESGLRQKGHGSEFPHPGCDPLPRYCFYRVSGCSHY